MGKTHAQADHHKEIHREYMRTLRAALRETAVTAHQTARQGERREPFDANGRRDRDAMKTAAAALTEAYAPQAAAVVTPQVRGAFQYYQNVNFERVNQALRAGRPGEAAVQRRVIDVMDSTIAQMHAPQEVTTYFGRKTNLTEAEAQALVGTVVRSAAYRSTTLDPLYPITNFTGDATAERPKTIYALTIPRGAPALWMASLGQAPKLMSQGMASGARRPGYMAKLGWENEMLLPRNAALHVTGISHVPADYYQDIGGLGAEYRPPLTTVVHMRYEPART